MTNRSVAWRLAALGVGALGAIFISSLLGYTRVPFADVLAWRDALDAQTHNVFWRLRAPRAALGACAGAGLGLGGVVFQTLFRNPLATPYTLGIDSGAALAAAVGYLLGLGQMAPSFLPTTVGLAFGGALAALGIVALMARLRPGGDMTRLLLAGVCVAYLSGAGVLLVTYLAGQAVTNEIIYWMMGSLAAIRPRGALEIALLLVPALLLALGSHRALDVLGLGQEWAAARGVNVRRVVWWNLVGISLLTGAIVANCGPIGFVSLMAPHIVRAWLGPRTLPLLIGSALAGAGFLAACDGVARLAAGARELPVGVVTNIVGALFFFYLLARRDMSYGRM